MSDKKYFLLELNYFDLYKAMARITSKASFCQGYFKLDPRLCEQPHNIIILNSTNVMFLIALPPLLVGSNPLFIYLLALKRIRSKATKWNFDLIILRNQLFCSSLAVVFILIRRPLLSNYRAALRRLC